MIFYLQYVGDDPIAAIIFFAAIGAALLCGITFHEFSHAFVADQLGDRLPRSRGRVTLNPLAHLDPAGTLLMVLIGFGWGNPVPINPNATRNPKLSLTLTAAAGPLSNFVVAAIAGLPLRLGYGKWISPFNSRTIDALLARDFSTDEYVSLFLSSIVLFSLILGVFNLLPIAPLDGFKVALGLLPRDLSAAFARTERYGMVILLVLVFSSFLTGGEFSILFEIMQPPVKFLARLLAGASGDVFY